MYLLIGGAGLVGLSLARELVELGHTIAVIDTDPTACRYAREQVGVMAFDGSAVSTQVLLEAGIRKADAVAAVLRDDALNLAMVTLAKHYGVPHIVSRMRQRDFEGPLRLAGAHHIVSTVDLAVNTMLTVIEYPQVESMMHYEQGQVEVFKIAIPPESHVAGRSVGLVAKDSRFPEGSLIIGYQPHPHADLVIPNANTMLETGSTVLVVTKSELLHQVVDFLGLCSNRPLDSEVAH
ncbi:MULTISPECIES: potassium channel family protein [unclassified Coleofasciculus]|uniref:potassium channel family protein n=1 Tax=unclassified Coleofasciculus TaxID=2692782 RepID=UPI0018828ABC|nr:MULTISPECIES: TrkA family potassium uptake protein [unclassified Coleofasciculus]MBE9125105.1 TrkA family potassium uptake protein [Coleofasciculus sp. LEGE 07081]MBE9150108.1 TrkA family potassium uptake protein [Coleofasciculus sp. LEGE 07092]